MMNIYTNACLILKTADLKAAKFFYKQLGFKQTKTKQTKALTLSDGQIQLLLNQKESLTKYSNFPTSLCLYTPHLALSIAQIRLLGISIEQTEDSSIVYFSSPENTTIFLTDKANLFADLSTIKKQTTTGNFLEYGIYTKDLEESKMFWEKLGFKSTFDTTLLYPYALLRNDVFTIGLHEVEELKAPVIAFIHKNLPTNIERLKVKGISIKEQMMPNSKGEYNVYRLESPDEQNIFLSKKAVLGYRMSEFKVPEKMMTVRMR